ncbi:MAG: metallophosphoesterase [Spirochaetota bacterium]
MKQTLTPWSAVPGTIRVIAVTLILAALTPLGAVAEGQSERESPELVAVNMADTHSAYDAYPRILTAVDRLSKQYAGQNLVFLFNGDLFELGNAAALKSEGEADWEFLRRLREYGPVVINIGNHEFDFVPPEEFIETALRYDITVIGNIADASGRAPAPSAIDLAAGGATVRVVGVATNAMNTYPEPYRETLKIPDPVDWTADSYAELVQGADYSILLSHAGLLADRDMLATLPANTLFAVGGHDHLVLQEEINGIPYMHNGFRGELVAVTEVYLSGTTPRLATHTIRVPDIDTADPAMTRTIEAVRTEYLDAEDTAVVATVPRDMTVLEAAMWSVEAVRDAVGADVAFLNHSSFGSGLSEGPLPKYRFDQFMRFDNDVMRAEVDASTLRSILERSNQHTATAFEERTGDFLYASEIDVEDGETYEIVTSSWVALDFNQERYLGTEISFEQVEGVTTKGILTDALTTR